MSVLDNYNRKIISLMDYNIKKFKKKEIDFSTLINELDGLFRIIKTWDNKWDEDFFRNWLNLESVYASNIDENIFEFNSEDLLIVENSINELDSLITEQLVKYVKIPDETVYNKTIEINNHCLLCPDCLDEWETSSQDAMVICPSCNNAFHNSSYEKLES